MEPVLEWAVTREIKASNLRSSACPEHEDQTWVPTIALNQLALCLLRMPRPFVDLRSEVCSVLPHCHPRLSFERLRTRIRLALNKHIVRHLLQEQQPRPWAFSVKLDLINRLLLQAHLHSDSDSLHGDNRVTRARPRVRDRAQSSSVRLRRHHSCRKVHLPLLRQLDHSQLAHRTACAAVHSANTASLVQALQVLAVAVVEVRRPRLQNQLDRLLTPYRAQVARLVRFRLLLRRPFDLMATRTRTRTRIRTQPAAEVTHARILACQLSEVAVPEAVKSVAAVVVVTGPDLNRLLRTALVDEGRLAARESGLRDPMVRRTEVVSGQ